MICVTVGRGRHRMALAEHAALAEQGAELVELRIDLLSRQPDLGRLLSQRPTPVVITCRRPPDGGRYLDSEDQRLALLRQAIVAGVEYVDLEEDAAARVPRYGSTKRIVSYHNFSETPEDLAAIHARLSRLDPDIIKIVGMANSPLDSVRMLKFLSQVQTPTIAFCMGEFGMPSRILCGRYGAPFTYASARGGVAIAPGQLPFHELRDLYHYDRIDRDTAVFGVLGDPIGHSWSPKLHNAAFRAIGMNAVYLPFRIPAEQFAESLDAMEFLGIRGYSVTIPHKHAALEYAAVADEASRRIGAANTLFQDENGQWQAMNTDYAAAMKSIQLGLKASGRDSLAGQTALLLGAGGAARAIAWGLKRAGAKLHVANRSINRAKQLAEELDAIAVSWQNRGSVSADLLVNCTPIGMSPNMDESPYQPNWLPEKAVVFDTIYNPENTLLIKESRERGCHTVSGVEMFIRQAAAQFKLFAGQEVDLETLRKTLRVAISPARATAPQPQRTPDPDRSESSPDSAAD